MIFAALAAVFVAMTLILIRAFVGPGLYNRILAINMFGTKIVLFIALVGFFFHRPAFLDIALLYALVNFVAVIAVLRLTHYEELLADRTGDDQG